MSTSCDNRVREEAGPVAATVDPADIRGLVTTLLVSVGRLPLSRLEGPCRPRNGFEGCAKPGQRLFPNPASNSCITSIYTIGPTSCAMAHMKHANSRATAVTTMFRCLPRPISFR